MRTSVTRGLILIIQNLRLVLDTIFIWNLPY
jgi:hypothetical protein